MGVTVLIVGGYLLALGIAGINAYSGLALVSYSLVLVLGFVLTGWAVLLPWDGGHQRHPQHDAPGPVPKP